eukprot:scaffold618_cov372-Prasinococcus_capsulatus_cf.AAC.6
MRDNRPCRVRPAAALRQRRCEGLAWGAPRRARTAVDSSSGSSRGQAAQLAPRRARQGNRSIVQRGPQPASIEGHVDRTALPRTGRKGQRGGGRASCRMRQARGGGAGRRAGRRAAPPGGRCARRELGCACASRRGSGYGRRASGGSTCCARAALAAAACAHCDHRSLRHRGRLWLALPCPDQATDRGPGPPFPRLAPARRSLARSREIAFCRYTQLA